MRRRNPCIDTYGLCRVNSSQTNCLISGGRPSHENLEPMAKLLTVQHRSIGQETRAIYGCIPANEHIPGPSKSKMRHRKHDRRFQPFLRTEMFFDLKDLVSFSVSRHRDASMRLNETGQIMLNMQCLLDLTRIAWVDLMQPSMALSTDLNIHRVSTQS